MAAPSPSSLPNGTSPHGPSRHDKYYIDDANTVFLVENVLFKVHRHFLKRDTNAGTDSGENILQTMFRLPQGPNAEGTSDENPIPLLQYKAKDFANLLWMFYNDTFDFSPTAASIDKWISILALSTQWELESIRKVALRSLAQLPLDPFQKLNVCWSYNYQDKEWAYDAFERICGRSNPITKEEARKLGAGDKISQWQVVDIVLAVAKAREQRAKYMGNYNYNASATIREAFDSL